MRLKNIPLLLNPVRYIRLQRDFRQPFRALLASSGFLSSNIELFTKSGDRMIVNRADRLLWEAYFKPDKCKVEITQGMFHVFPTNSDHRPYYVRGASGGHTWNPQRFSESVPQLVEELQQQEWSVYSQHGEDGVIQSLLQRISVKHRYVVEFGAYDGVCMSNSRYLIENDNWNAFLIEADPRFYRGLKSLYKNHPRVKIKQGFVTEDNINKLFLEAGVPRDFEVLSIDVDGPDYYLWQALTEFEPRIVIIEYNSTIDPQTEYVIPRDKLEEYGGTSREGASLLSFWNLAIKKGYQPVYSELSGANIFFIHNEITDEFDLNNITPETLYQPPQFGELAGTIAPNGRGYC
jgi:hypothetical protein